MTDEDAPASVVCGACGAPAPAPVPLTWSTSHGPRETSVLCPTCTRRHLRAMEARLDEEHW